ncbi:hypothetical protein Peur_048105 [Populus x canadensis]
MTVNDENKGGPHYLYFTFSPVKWVGNSGVVVCCERRRLTRLKTSMRTPRKRSHMGPTNYFPTEEAKEQPPHPKFPRSHALCYKLDKLTSSEAMALGVSLS